MTRRWHAVLIGLGIGLLGFGLSAKEPTIASWQLVTGDAYRCFEPGERATLRLNDGVNIQTVARLVVVHVDRKQGIVTFGERQ